MFLRIPVTDTTHAMKPQERRSATKATRETIVRLETSVVFLTLRVLIAAAFVKTGVSAGTKPVAVSLGTQASCVTPTSTNVKAALAKMAAAVKTE